MQAKEKVGEERGKERGNDREKGRGNDRGKEEEEMGKKEKGKRNLSSDAE